MTSSHHAPYAQGDTRATMAGTARGDHASGSGSLKAGLSSDRSLQLDSMKLESLVIADQHAAVNTFPGLVHTARHTMRAGKARKREPNPQGKAAPKAGPVIGVKSKQGIPSRTRGWITSFLRRKTVPYGTFESSSKIICR